MLQLKVNITYKINCSTIRSEKIEIINIIIIKIIIIKILTLEGTGSGMRDYLRF